MRPGPAPQGMTFIVKTVTRMTVGLILLYGIYVILQGHSSPGGGFAGGVIIALSFIHMNLAFGGDFVRKRFAGAAGGLAARLDAPLLMSLAMLGFWGAIIVHSACAHRGYGVRPYDALVMQLCHVCIGLNVGAGLYAIFSALVAFRPDGEERG